PPTLPPTSPLPLHDALPISASRPRQLARHPSFGPRPCGGRPHPPLLSRHPRGPGRASDRNISAHLPTAGGASLAYGVASEGSAEDRKSTRLNSSHVSISYAV